MRTTIRLDDRLLADTKKLAAENGRTVSAVIEEALREVVGRRRKPRPGARLRFTTFRGQGLCAAVDLDNSAALLGLMQRTE